MKNEGDLKLLEDKDVGELIVSFRMLGFETINTGPNVLPHTVMAACAMMHGIAQVAAMLVTEYTLNNPIEVSNSKIAIDGITNDGITFITLLGLRANRLGSNGVFSEMTPSIMKMALADFQQLRGRPPEGLADYVYRVASEADAAPTKEATHYVNHNGRLN
jgi:hypothetical protein